MIKDYNGNNPTTANATQTSNGLMSATDKTKLDNLGLSIDTLPIGSEVLIDSDKDIPEGWEEVEEVYSNPNMLINGDFQINQYNTVGMWLYVNTVAKYLTDRWIFTSTSSTKIFLSNKLNNTGLNITNSDASAPAISIQQYLEAPLTTNEYYTISWSIGGVIDYFTFKKSTDTVSHNGMQYIPCNVTNGSKHDSIKLTLTIQNETKCIDYIKLEPGTIATKQISKTNIEELLNCRRYYYRIIGDHTSSLLGGNIYSNTIYINIPTQVPMRTLPTFRFSNLKAIMDGEISFGFMESYTDFSYTTDTIHFIGKFELSATGSRSGSYGRLLFNSDQGYVSFNSEIYS